ncbi:MAG: DNA (cytosine-5-)-methyltransferase [Eubacteriales bacterium]
MKPLTVGSLFSGIGAFERALERLNIDYELEYYCEVDKYASTAYSAIHNIDESFNLGDITKIDIDSLPYVDLITHGSPCQDFSIAGKQKGADKGTNTRSSLMWNTVEIIKHTKPKYVIWENVKNVLSDKHIHNFKKYKKTLRELGYKNYSKVINAKHWGIPQNRERIFVVSIRKDIDTGFCFPISSLEGQQSLFNQNVIDIEPKVLRDVLENEVDEKYYIDDKKTRELLKELTVEEIGINPCITPERLDKRQNGRRFKENNEDMFTLTSQDRHGVLISYNRKEGIKKEIGVAHALNSSDYRGLNRNQDQNAVLEMQKICLRDRGNIRIKEDDISNCLAASYYKGMDNHAAHSQILEIKNIGGFKDGKLELNPNGEYSQANRVYSVDGLACTRQAEGGGKGAKTGLYLVYNNKTYQLRIRRLTPLECFRLMGFDDKDYFKARKTLENKYYNGQNRSDSQMYKMAGNSIVVNVLEYIFKELFKEKLQVKVS